MDLTARTDRRDFRLAACATPIAAPGVSDFQTIESATNVAFLNPPMTIGTVLVEAPRPRSVKASTSWRGFSRTRAGSARRFSR